LSASVAGLVPQLRAAATIVVNWSAQYGGRLTSTYRSYTDQLALWNNRGRNPYPVAPPGSSYHQLGRAFDIAAPPAVLAAAGAWWNSIGGTWSPRDPIHFQA